MSGNAFWAWLQTNGRRLRDAVVEPRDDDPLFEEVLERLHREHSELFFLMGGEPEGEMEFIVTAEGDPAHFPAVEALVAAAPTIPGWSLIAFKPPMGHELVLNHEGAVIDGEETWFRLEGAHVVLAVGGWHAKAEDAYQFAAVELLDAVLGERLAVRVDTVEVVALPAMPEKAGFQRLARLAELISGN